MGPTSSNSIGRSQKVFIDKVLELGVGQMA